VLGQAGFVLPRPRPPFGHALSSVDGPRQQDELLLIAAITRASRTHSPAGHPAMLDAIFTRARSRAAWRPKLVTCANVDLVISTLRIAAENRHPWPPK